MLTFWDSLKVSGKGSSDGNNGPFNRKIVITIFPVAGPRWEGYENGQNFSAAVLSVGVFVMSDSFRSGRKNIITAHIPKDAGR